MPPSRSPVASPCDGEARHGIEREARRLGRPQGAPERGPRDGGGPHLITHGATAATVTDVELIS
jgi:hypothetical protein